MAFIRNEKTPSRTIRSPRRRGTPDAIRTHDLQSRSLTLYPTELRARISLRPIHYNRKAGKSKERKEEDFSERERGL